MRASIQARGWTWRLAIPVVALATVGQLALASAPSSASRVTPAADGAGRTAGAVAPARVNDLDCNGWSPRYASANPGFKKLCTDPVGFYDGHVTRFYDNSHYVGHDEPSVKFISSLKGSGNTFTYDMRLPKDPSAAPTANGSVVDYGELSVAPWFGLPICDPQSYPQNACTPDSDTNSGANTNPKAAGSAFMELQFYPPGFTPFIDSGSCSATQWCSALNIDSLECNFGFATCNPNCIEPVSFSYLQTNGVPPGPPAPQDPDLGTWLGNGSTLKMNPGDVVKVSISDPAGGLTATVDDMTTKQTGTMQASAKNGWMDTNMSTCKGSPFTYHAEYSTAKQPNQVPWAALQGGVLMEQEIGHGEVCSAVTNTDGFSATFSDGAYSDPKAAETCTGGQEGSTAKGEGPCNTTTGACANSTTQSASGPAACADSNYQTSTDHCEFADGFCFPKGTRAVTIAGKASTESARVAFCYGNQFQNGDLDFDGVAYHADWPNGSASFPQTFEYIGPFTTGGKTYSQVQYETDAPGSEQLCDTKTGTGCTLPPAGAAFYPFWSINAKQTMAGVVSTPGVCIWNFGNDITGVTKNDFGKDKQYGKPAIAVFGGTSISAVRSNPTLGTGCKPL